MLVVIIIAVIIFITIIACILASPNSYPKTGVGMQAVEVND